MDDKTRLTMNECVMGAEIGPQTIVVRQVLGEAEQQKVLDIDVVLPAQKPAIEQIVDVFVKNLEINSVDVITDKVIVRGEFEVKAVYVASLPDLPVHAVEVKHYRWTQDIVVPGARRGMDADASVTVEFVDYDVECDTRAYKYKNFEMDDEECDDQEDTADTCDDTCEDTCEDHHHHHHHHHLRHFDVSVVLKIVAKVMTDREITINPGTVPTTPKG